MVLLVFCLVINSLIGVIFKLYHKYGIDNYQAITINYFICVLTGSVVLGKLALPSDLFDKPWFWISVFMGFLFVVTFNLMALTVQNFGVSIATIFQKMSLIAPALLAIFIYNESAPVTKMVGIFLAIMSIILLSYNKQKNQDIFHAGWIVFLPISIFVGSCIVDSCLYLVDKEALAPNGDIEFVSSLFFFAGFFGLIKLIYLSFRKKVVIKTKNIIGGIALGIPNFFSIYLILLLLSKGWQGSVVFPVNNVGVLILATFFGYLFFKEKLTGIKIVGFVLACTAITLIAL
ncbi:MAG: EamA family transporter [Saprospiraceae bacterium]